MCNFGLIRDPDDTVQALADAVGCKSSRTRSLLRCLRKIEAKHLAVVRGDIEYGLTVETHTDDLSDVFMPDTPLNLVRDNKSHNVPWILGINSEESVGTALGKKIQQGYEDKIVCREHNHNMWHAVFSFATKT